MDTPSFRKILLSVPESMPRILDLSWELVDSSGRVGRDLTAGDLERIEQAEQEARTHSAATRRLAGNIRRSMSCSP